MLSLTKWGSGTVWVLDSILSSVVPHLLESCLDLLDQCYYVHLIFASLAVNFRLFRELLIMVKLLGTSPCCKDEEN